MDNLIQSSTCNAEVAKSLDIQCPVSEYLPDLSVGVPPTAVGPEVFVQPAAEVQGQVERGMGFR